MMKGKLSKSETDVNYEQKMCDLLDNYTKVLVVSADKVKADQLQLIRKDLRDDSVVLMGNKTHMIRCIIIHAERTGKQAYLSLLPLLVGNVGLLFTKGNFKEVIEELAKHEVVIQSLYDGGLVFSPELLDLSEDDLVEKFSAGLSSMVTLLSLAISYPKTSEMFVNAYNNLLAVATATDHTFPQSEKIKEYLKDPSRFLVAAAAAASAIPAAAPAAPAASANPAAAAAAAPVATVLEPDEESSNDVEFTK